MDGAAADGDGVAGGRALELGRAAGYARLRGLVQLGLLEHARIFHAAPGVYLATRGGLASVDLSLPPARVDLRTYVHEDRTPSLHVSEDPRRGWYCFSCRQGGSVYDFAALLLGRGTRGEEFIELRRELEAILG